MSPNAGARAPAKNSDDFMQIPQKNTTFAEKTGNIEKFQDTYTKLVQKPTKLVQSS
jgi:hypothetical protein